MAFIILSIQTSVKITTTIGRARGLGEHGFTPEDAKVLSYGTFGLTPSGSVIGVSFVARFDQSFINNYRMHLDHL